MSRGITLDITHPTQLAGRVEGFRFLWAYYVRGYRPDRHCQACFRGRLVPGFCTATAEVGRVVRLDAMDRFPYVYVCGVGAGPLALRRARNLHLPLAHAPGEVVEVTTYNGYRVRARDARRLDIPPLPAGWEGKPEAHVRCKNFQFAVAHFGYPPRDASSMPTVSTADA